VVSAAASDANSSSNPLGRDERDEEARKEEEKAAAAASEVRHAQAAARCGRPIGGGRRFR
jgi:hypothetical protein